MTAGSTDVVDRMKMRHRSATGVVSTNVFGNVRVDVLTDRVGVLVLRTAKETAVNGHDLERIIDEPRDPLLVDAIFLLTVQRCSSVKDLAGECTKPITVKTEEF